MKVRLQHQGLFVISNFTHIKPYLEIEMPALPPIGTYIHYKNENFWDKYIEQVNEVLKSPHLNNLHIHEFIAHINLSVDEKLKNECEIAEVSSINYDTEEGVYYLGLI